MMAELLGKETGYCKGRGGSMHLAAPEIGMLGACGIVGAGIPISLGPAFASQYQGTGLVTLSFFGDGASNQGTFHESLNLASVWKLPVVFVCENNLLAVTTPSSRTLSVENIADRATSYGMPGRTVDGGDVLAVHEITSEAVKRARRGHGPSLIECKTVRFEPHCISTAELRTKEEMEECKRNDPIVRFEQRLLKDGVLARDEVIGEKEEAELAIEQAVEFAKKDPFPERERYKDYVYS